MVYTQPYKSEKTRLEGLDPMGLDELRGEAKFEAGRPTPPDLVGITLVRRALQVEAFQ